MAQFLGSILLPHFLAFGFIANSLLHPASLLSGQDLLLLFLFLVPYALIFGLAWLFKSVMDVLFENKHPRRLHVFFKYSLVFVFFLLLSAVYGSILIGFVPGD